MADIMFGEAVDCRSITEGDLIKRRKSGESLIGSTLAQRKSACPSSEQSIANGLVAIPLGSSARMQSTLNGTAHHFDCAEWVLNDNVERLTDDGMNKRRRVSEKMIDRRRQLRAETLAVIFDVLLKYQGEHGFKIGWKDTLNIAGYAAMGSHPLPCAYTETVSLRQIKSPPVNMETLFARLSVAIKNCMLRNSTLKQLKKGEVATISKADSLSWRGDDHLSEFKVPCIFERREQSCVS
jgi:hypothetical protein